MTRHESYLLWQQYHTVFQDGLIYIHRKTLLSQHCIIYFRWASFLGKLLTELAVDGKTCHDITDFKFERPAVTDPNFTPHFYYGIGQSSKL